MTDWQQHLRAEMLVRGSSTLTISHYTGWLRRLSAFHGKNPKHLKQSEVRDYLVHLQTRKLKPATHHLVLAAFRFFFRLYGMPEVVEGFRRPAVRPLPREVLSEEEISRILKEARSLRDKTFFNLIYASGLRLREALDLCIRDIDLERRTVLVRSGKNLFSRQSIFGASTEALLREYLRHHRPRESCLFPSLTDPYRSLAGRSIQHAFTLAVRRSGIKKSVSVHSLRHAFATHLAERNTNLFIIMRLLGHRRLATTQVYLGESAIERLQVRSPVDHLESGLSLKALPGAIQLCLPGDNEQGSPRPSSVFPRTHSQVSCPSPDRASCCRNRST